MNRAWKLVLCLFPLVLSCQSSIQGTSDSVEVPVPRIDVWPDVRASFFPIVSEEGKKLDDAFSWIVDKTQTPGMTAALCSTKLGFWSRSHGDHPLFYWASVGKTFTAAMIFQLVQEGKITLDSKLSFWYPDFPGANDITIEQLLRHTSGIFSFQEDEGFQSSETFIEADELIAIARKHGNLFPPGKGWHYSNTGYLFLGKIVEKVEGRSYHEVAERKILQRLGLTATKVLAPREISEDVAPIVNPVTGRAFMPSQPYGAGVVVATAEDMIRFWHGFLTGRLFDLSLVKRCFVDLRPLFESRSEFYGAGVMVYDVPDPEWSGLWMGHSGGTPGSHAVVALDLKTGIFVAVACNSPAPAEASALKLLKAVRGTP